MKKTAILVLLLTASLFSITAKAANPFSDCGIGAALFPKTNWAAVTSNVIWDLGTTATSSATSSKSTCNGANHTAAIFINETYESLEQDFVEGEGQFIGTLATLLSCDGHTTQQLTSQVRAKMSTQDLADKTRLQKAENLYLNIMATDAVNSCSINA